ncbi:MAG: hypothetical protein H6R07_2155 [Proteobacteria bacterium]|nr:hypothetical protein [Pseudomonadota bacterium]
MTAILNKGMNMNKLLAIAVMAFALSSAFAADPFTDAVQKAYAPYRTALFKTNSNSQPEAQQAMQQAQQTWAQIVAQFATRAPAPYDRDVRFAVTLAEVASVYAQAATEVSQNQLPQAHETLEKVRDLLADLRHRNQVIVYSDHMNAYHSAMEQVINEGEKLLAQPDGMQRLTAQAGVLAYLGEKLTAEAPAEYLKNEEFITLAKAQKKSVDDLQAALFALDAKAVKAAIGKLKGPYSRMFLKFG